MTGDKEHLESPLDRIHRHINQEMRPQIQNAYHLAALITSFCVNTIDECRAQTRHGPETLFDMFAGSIAFAVSEGRNFSLGRIRGEIGFIVPTPDMESVKAIGMKGEKKGKES